MKKITFVVLHYGNVSNTQECLKSLCSMDPVKNLHVDVVVVDNKSPDPFPDNTVHCGVGKVVAIRNDKNLGYTGGMNTGIRQGIACGADYICVVNNDTVFDKEFLKICAKRLEEEKDLGILVPKIYFYKGTEFHHDRYKEEERGKVIWYAGGKIDWNNVYASHKGVDEVDFGQHDKEIDTSFATGCCMVFQTSVLQKVGFFDDKYYLYYEDIDLSMRIKKAGYRIIFEPKAKLWHKNARAAGGAGSILQDYYISRNRMFFSMLYAPFRAKVSILREGFRILLSGREWQKKGVRDFFLRRFHRGSFNP